MKNNLIIVSLLVASLPACTWVETTEGGSEVTLVKAFNVKDCIKLGATTVNVKHQVGIIVRDEETVREELVIVARNRAAELGGDSIVAKSEPDEGSMSFDIYKCGE